MRKFREAAVRSILVFPCEDANARLAKSQSHSLRAASPLPVPGPARCTSGRAASVLCKRDNYPPGLPGKHKESTARGPREIKS